MLIPSVRNFTQLLEIDLNHFSVTSEAALP